ncbi:hypothetical protein K1W54_06750 [Micromonospora sp. CPCC 205371]|nr:hypothetical protein [Micromonospora sp. CPCC 205371]
MDVPPWREYLTGSAVGYANRCGLLIGGRPATEDATWRQVAEVANQDCADDGDLIWVDENGDAYRICTWSRDSRWEGWWMGRERFRFRHTADADTTTLIDPWYGLCDGGPLHLLDLQGMRELAERKARWEREYWDKIRASTPEPTLLPVWHRLVADGELSNEQASDAFMAQPRVAIARRLDILWRLDDELGPLPEDHVARARAWATAAYSMVTLDGRWLDTNDGDPYEYAVAASEHLDSLPPQAWAVICGYHV